MLNPKQDETMIDTAAGSCGFPVHTIFYVWEQILKSKGESKDHLFTLKTKPTECIDYVRDKVLISAPST
jgi:type I restriction enzyme M protein